MNVFSKKLFKLDVKPEVDTLPCKLKNVLVVSECFIEMYIVHQHNLQ